MIENPFVTKGYAGPEYFCDRVKETHDILQLVTNGNNIALISPRRIGKTDLITHCFSQREISDHYYAFHIDIYATTSLRDFVNVFGMAILETLKPLGRKIWEKFVSVLKSLQAELSYDINNNPSWSLGLGDIQNPLLTLDEIFQYLQNADRPCIVAIDEFQQIIKYKDEKSAEALLRTYIQRCPNATFIFAGSKRHLMTEMFTSPARPFYQSVIPMGLKRISIESYTEFAVGCFEEYGKTVDPAVVENVYRKFDGITASMQRMMNVLFFLTPANGHCTIDMVDKALQYILDLFDDNYATLLESLPEKQREVFRAIAAEGKAKGVTGSKFIRKYHLQTASVVNAALRGLMDKDLVTVDNGEYSVYDPFLARWMEGAGAPNN